MDENNKLERQIRMNDFYYNTFEHKPYLRETYIEHQDKLLHIEKSIREQLSDCPNFEGIDFCDVNAGGINIRGHHAKIKGYTYGGQPKINYDFSNMEEVIDEFVSMWKASDTTEKVDSQIQFIEAGERWGWD